MINLRIIIEAVLVASLWCMVNCYPVVTTCPRLNGEQRSQYQQLLQDLFPEQIAQSSTSLPSSAFEIASASESNGKHCPSSTSDLPSGLGDEPQARGTCPWYLEIDHDPHRYPAVIYVARKRCDDSCVGMGTDFSCEYVYTNITVLRKVSCDVTSSTGTVPVYKFIEEVKLFPVASVCAKKREVVSSTHLVDDAGSFQPLAK